LRDPHLNGEKLGVGACACHLREDEYLKIGGLWSRLLWAEKDPASKLTKIKSDWRHGSSGKAPVSQE
jgi:hypothetical protein